MRKCAVARKYNIPDSFQGNEHTDRGNELEPKARDLFRSTYSLDVREVACVEHDNGLCGGSPDSLIYSESGNLISGLEIKCLKDTNHEAAYISLVNKKLPTIYKPQVHGLIWLTGLPSWIFMVYHDDDLPFEHKELEVTPDQYTQDLGGHVLEFCKELDYRADEFIEDFDKSLKGASAEEVMPILFSQLESGEEMVA